MNAHPLAWRGWRAALLVVAVLVGAGCAGVATVRGEMHYQLADADVPLVWPPAPEVARYRFAGTLTGESNFRPRGVDAGALQRLGRWIAGLDEAAPAPLVLQRPSAVIGDERGRVYVSDTSRQAVFVFDEAAGELHVWERASALLNFVAPSGLALAPEGGVFVADAELGFVARLDARGEPLAVLGRGVLKRPTGLARDPASGRLFVADTMAHDIKVFDAAGALQRVIGRRGAGEGEFNFPTHLAFSRGELIVTDTMNSRVQVFAAGGDRFVRSLGTRGMVLGNLVRPKGVAVDGDANVYVVESYHDSLLVFSPRGEFLLPIGGTGSAAGRFFLPAGVWVDSTNRVYVADMFNGRVVRFQFLGGG